MQIVFHSVDRETLKTLEEVNHNSQSRGKNMQNKDELFSHLREWCSCPDCTSHVNPEPGHFQMTLEWRWSMYAQWRCAIPSAVHLCEVISQFSIRDLNLFIGYFLMSFTCMASISVTDELILEISCPDLQGSPA